MKIGIYCTNNIVFPVPPDQLYANMMVAGELANSLVDLGEDVTFFAPVGTQTKAKLVSFDMLPFNDKRIWSRYPGSESSYNYENIMLINALNYMEANNFDIFHTHCRPFSVLNFASIKNKLNTLSTIHDPLDQEPHQILSLYRQFKNVHLVSLTQAQQKVRPGIDWFGNVYNGLDMEQWKFYSNPGKYLLYVGRITADKGVDLVIDIALKADMPLKIVGSPFREDERYFKDKIMPRISGRIEYIGSISRDQLSDIYGNALALVMPIRWEEPFGLVMIESMACGTPVIASRHGSVPEIVKDGATGVIVDHEDDTEGFIKALEKVDQINRTECRRQVEESFTLGKTVQEYRKLYRKLVVG